MVEDAKTRASSVTEGKMARGCDACTGGSNASWYCPADDAFLCQRCDASIHSANELAKRHERVRLQSSSSPVKKTSVWYEGFTRKARTPRNKGLRHGKLSQIDSTDPLVPDLGGEEEDGFLSFSSTDENDESLNYLVPVFDPFSDMLIDDINSFDLIPDGDTITTNGGDMEEIMGGDGLSGILPLDLDLAGLNMDVESLLKEEEQPCLGVKEEGDLGFELNCKGLSSVKDEVDVEQKRESGKEFVDEDRNKSLFLRLDYESVIGAWGSHGTPWKTETKPEFKSGDSLQGAQRTYPSHVLGKDAAVGCATRQQGRGGSDGDREARVLRYKEKRRTRLFAKKIRYEVRKLNAEQRPRIKGRFVKRSSL